VDSLSRGGLVLHPTETILSLSGDPYSDAAVARARALKGYASPRPFLCLVASIDAARSLARAWPAEAELLASRFWPGPLTLLLPASDDAPAAVAAAGTIAIRPAADPVSAALLAAWGRALFSTSANRRGEPAHRDVVRAMAELGTASGGDTIEVALLPIRKDDPAGLPSTIVDATTHPVRIVREGAIPAETIRGVVGELGEVAR
jgi:L-threonylcarbamoyladenylate synthase